MKDILTIVFRLTVSCLLAATVMGIVFIFTSNAKKHNEHLKEQKVMYELLGYTGDANIPDSVAMQEIYRYVISGADSQSIGYVLAMGEGEQGFLFVNIGLDGSLLESKPIDLTETDALDVELRNKVVQELVGPAYSADYADTTTVVTDDGSRIAYILGGKFQGYKTLIQMMLAVDPDFSLVGIEVLEHEEDPGLGADIEKDFFKNQFKGKPFEAVKNIDVVKEPIPSDYLQALTGKSSEEELLEFREQYKDHDIYALTGATISSRAVSNGVKGIVTKFAYRISVLDKVLKEQPFAVSF
jgi:electron transport complex protein RnfG